MIFYSLITKLIINTSVYSKLATMSTSRILVVISFLVVILIYSSVAKFDASAKPKNYKDILCTKKSSPAQEASITLYFTNLLPDGKPGQQSHQYCADCKLKPDSSYACGDYHEVFRTIGNPPSVGLTQPPSAALPPSSATYPPSESPSPTNQQPPTTATCPGGSAPDANSNCPTSTTTNNQQLAPSSSTLTEQNHHKGSNLLAGGQEATKATKVKY
jgi:hypothetical protein